MEFIQAQLIKLNVSVNNWKDAIMKAGQPLIDSKLITKNYLNSVIQIAEETGPYIVFTPHVALSHAKAEDGALKDGIGLTTLKNPVNFGNKDNDPVKYIFTLSSTEKNGHLNQMAQLIKILSQKDFFKKLNEAKDTEEAANYINKLAKE
ncbi:PTS sugar transporter subunit IIA [Ligilactobacillus acidipiscis]|uniref:PTS sugar transporter subunit IIA n=1 Tax=Ligilactobacillus acidipiscis TaxID=89059 RepID=UPI0022E8A6CA|nr:PTS sugar transporter subunit IIA [Ligilactobacillus acidipiscis]